MKKRTIIINCLLILALIATLAACGSTPKKPSTGEVIDDSVITTKVKALLAADNLLKSIQIGVETYRGTVQLSGFVDSREVVEKAVQITKSVQGVKAVKNNLIVK
ncbi:MAG: transporter [Desulfobacterales bacterium CG07_land_8_20_14_0_80_52_14]|nr:MAG: transporter [Desulfobacterales bacterium CG07_land_8_20_14_0_80_52_14]